MKLTNWRPSRRWGCKPRIRLRGIRTGDHEIRVIYLRAIELVHGKGYGTAVLFTAIRKGPLTLPRTRTPYSITQACPSPSPSLLLFSCDFWIMDLRAVILLLRIVLPFSLVLSYRYNIYVHIHIFRQLPDGEK